MISKLVGAGLVIGIAGWTGLQKASSLTRRTEGLRQIKLAFGYLEKEISYARSPLEEALGRTAAVSSSPAKVLFQAGYDALNREKSVTAREAWEKGVAGLQRMNLFTEEDLEIIRMVGDRMGLSDAADQVNMLRLAAEELRLQEEKSRSRELSEKKLWSYGGFLAGIMVTILML